MRQVRVQFSYNREEDSYDAKCPWCGEVVRSLPLNGLIAQRGFLPDGVSHDCPVEP